MKKITTLVLLLFTAIVFANNNNDEEKLNPEVEAYVKKLDSVQSNFNYQTGVIKLEDRLAVLELPEGFTFLNKEEGEYVLEELWDNPHSDIIGLMFPTGTTATSDEFTYAVEITYTEDGYVKDEDVKDLNYDDLLEEMKSDTEEANKDRIKNGYPSIELLGWATPPFYDGINKKLHWAKEIKFEGNDVNTLNYNVRILGRKGYLNLNVIGDISQLNLVNKDIEKILNSVHFSKGQTYKDFDSELDNIAAYGIGGLIAGKVLAKAGVFALLIKFWKLIAISVVGAFSVFKKKILGDKS